MEELESIEVGFVYDLMIENMNDNAEYEKKATQEDIDELLG